MLFLKPVIDINRNYLKTIPIRPLIHIDQNKFCKLYNVIFTFFDKLKTHQV